MEKRNVEETENNKVGSKLNFVINILREKRNFIPEIGCYNRRNIFRNQ